MNSTEQFNDIVPAVLNRLAIDIIVKESKWTWIKEQR
jgi:hypothetical protein